MAAGPAAVEAGQPMWWRCAAFSWGAVHWLPGPLVAWAIANQVSVAAITDGLIFMAIAMVLVRTIALSYRASRLPARALTPQTA